MSKYPDHQVQALADGMSSLSEEIGSSVAKNCLLWIYAERALEFLGIEPEIPPTITVTVELPREEAEDYIKTWIPEDVNSLTPQVRVGGRVSIAIREALQ